MIHVKSDEARAGVENMALDCQLLMEAEAGNSNARVYSWSQPCVSLGVSQLPQQALIDPSFVPWVRRPTGGYAVLHGHDVTVGLAMSLSRLLESQEERRRSVRTLYRAVSRPLASALTMCGLPAVLAEDANSGERPTGAVSDCFAHVSPNDIIDPNSRQKVCGCAMKVTSRAVLLQASIPHGKPLVDPSLLFKDAQEVVIREWDEALLAGALFEALNA